MVKQLLYFAIFTAPMGANAFSVDVGFYQLTPFRFCVFAAVGISMLYVFGGQKRFVIQKGENTYSRLVMLLWLLYSLISVAWARDHSAWLRSVMFVGIGFVVTELFCYYFRTKEDIYKAFYAFQAGVLVQCAIGWYEIITRDYHYIQQKAYTIAVFTQRKQRIPVAMLNNPNNLGVLLLVGIGVACCCIVLSKRRFIKGMNTVFLINEIILLLMIQSRACIIGLAMMIGLYIWYNIKNKKILFALLVLGSVTVPFIIDYARSVLAFDFSEGSAYTRLNLILNGFAILGKTYGFGTGAGQSQNWLQTEGVFDTGRTFVLHNNWLEILAEYGIAFAICYGVHYIKLFMTFWRKCHSYDEDKKTAMISLSICMVMFGYIVACIAPSTMMSSEWNWVFWGIMIAYQEIINKNGHDARLDTTNNDLWR